MDERAPNPRDPGTHPVQHGNLLGPETRRDIADLNRLYLELSLEPSLEEDPRFALSDPVRAALGSCTGEVRGRLAQSPFCLFELRLPAIAPTGSNTLDRVADMRHPPPLDPATAARCQSFVLLALSIARQLAGGTPPSPRIALGLTAETEARLAVVGPSELARLAAWPGLVRPRWPRHERFWGMMIGAARTADAAIARWAHCAGLCLLATGQDGTGPTMETAKRRPRGPRGWPGRGVPC